MMYSDKNVSFLWLPLRENMWFQTYEKGFVPRPIKDISVNSN